MTKGKITTKSTSKPNEEEYEERSSLDLRRGPWTIEEDNLLIHQITCNGEGRWNSLAKCAGLKRTGKSCRLRWLNYLKPDIKRGNLTPQEQLLILELHTKWGNRWSKIARHLPGRTDNEIKNYWRTRVQKQARQLNIDSNSKKFLEAIKCFWMPRLLEKMEQSNSSLSSSSSSSNQSLLETSNKCSSDSAKVEDVLNSYPVQSYDDIKNSACNSSIKVDNCYYNNVNMTWYPDGSEGFFKHHHHQPPPEMESQDMNMNFSECQMSETDNWFNDDMPAGAFWNTDELWHIRKPEVGI